MKFAFVFSCFLYLLLGRVFAQTSLSCAASSAPPMVRSEGLSERLSDIVLNCSGTQPGGQVSATITVGLAVNVANRVDAQGVTDAVLTVDTGAGPAGAGASPRLAGPSSLRFEGITFTLGPSGTAVIRLSNLRGAVSQAGVSDGRRIEAFLGFGGPSQIRVNNAILLLGFSERGLLAGRSSTLLSAQIGSPLPSGLGMSSLFAAGTRLFSLRLTEGFADAFQPRQPLTDSGIRIIARYTGVPPGARLFVPDVLAGSSALQPTAGGDLGTPPSGGRHAPGGPGSLLLVRVRLHDANGAGGVLSFAPGPPGSGAVSFDSVSEVELAGGGGMAVYEVVDANPQLRESAQLPTFIGLAPVSEAMRTVIGADVSLGPLSAVADSSTIAPIPRFVASAPPQDCAALSDCDALFFPRLVVDPDPLSFTAVQGSVFQVRDVRLRNESGGVLQWKVTPQYHTAAGWLRIAPASGINNATVRVDAIPGSLPPGLYEATLTVDAGPLAGSRTLPVSLRITPAPPPPPSVPPPSAPEPPLIRVLGNAANPAVGNLVAGSLATLFGERFAGRDVQVSFDGLPSRILFGNERQLNVLVPSALAGRASVRVVVTVDGTAGAPYVVNLAPAAPAIFGILNQDSTLNAASNPEQAGNVVQVFATGLAGRITARIHDRDIDVPLFGGDAPSLQGVQQVNFPIPADLPAMTTEVLVCGGANGQRTCSLPVRITIRR